MFGRISIIGSLFPTLFLDGEGEGGGGGGIGDVGDIAHGHSGDVSILERGADDEGDGDDADDSDDDASASGDADENDEGEGDGTETFDDPDAEGDGEEGDDKDDKKGKEKEGEDDEVFEGRPTLTDIKAKYPKIFKDFPDLREVLFRENEFGKHFGSVEEAADAAGKASNFDLLEASLLAGDPSLVLGQLGENAPAAVAKLAENFLPALLSQSQDLYLTATIPVIEQFLHTAYEYGKANNDANLMRSMQHAAKFIFGKPDIPDPKRRAGNTGPHPAEQKLEQERKVWQETRFREASVEVSSEIDEEIETEILKGFSTKGMTDRQKTRFIKDVKDEIDATLSKDEAFKRQMKGLWSKAATADYPRDQRASIKSAFLARAKALVPSVRTRLRTEWFGEKDANSGAPSDKNKDKGQQPKKRTIPDSGRASSGGPRRPPSAKEVDFTKTSDLDLIEGRFARRK